MFIRGYLVEAQSLLRLASPLILTQLAQVAISTTDIVMMGLLGEASLAAGGLAFFIFNLLRTMGFGLVVGLSNMVAEAIGAGRDSALSDCLFAGLAVSSTAGLVAALLMLFGSSGLVYLGQEPAIVTQAAEYLAWMAPGILPAFWFYSYRGVSVGLRKAGPLLWITLVSIGVNAGLNYILIEGLFGLPRLGLAGIAAASSLVFLLSFFALAILTHSQIDFGRLRLDVARVWSNTRDLLRIGIPTSASYGSEAGFFAVIALMMGTVGQTALAAHTLVNQMVYIVFMIAIGLSHAASVGISEAVGRGTGTRKAHPVTAGTFSGQRPAEETISKVGRTAFFLGGTIMSIIAMFYFLAPERFITLITLKSGQQPAEVLALASSLLLIAGVLQIFDALQNIAIGTLRGLGQATRGFWITVAGYWFIGLPAAWFLGIDQHQGASGIWVGLLVGVAATACLMIFAFEYFSWARRSGVLQST
ncbi:MATE family efflux transporter [Kiloniella laminariae]|uniref:Multidrug-efflux transporter n=1 Tax=Kiloniella laminariae TaxID=454162 RepID=A0ABT4LGS3_9PROT|nr:MATE family efflux transporter [Kiloniella laminariae]MCZ4279541.1 MATE family efflux transporter [Kiloniella laminariae]